MVEVLNDPVVDAKQEIELAVDWQARNALDFIAILLIHRMQNDPAVTSRDDARVGIFVDRGIQDRSTKLV